MPAASPRDLVNLIPSLWLPQSLRGQILLRVIITGFLGTKVVVEDGNKALKKYDGNKGKGGRPRKGQQAQVKLPGAGAVRLLGGSKCRLETLSDCG